MKTGIKRENQNGFSAIHIDFTNNDESQGYDVFLDDAPRNAIVIPRRQLTERQLLEELKPQDVDII